MWRGEKGANFVLMPNLCTRLEPVPIHERRKFICFPYQPSITGSMPGVTEQRQVTPGILPVIEGCDQVSLNSQT